MQPAQKMARDLKPVGAESFAARKSINVQELLTVEEVAEMLRVPSSWVYGHTRRRATNRIPGFRLGKYWRFHEADVNAWIERQKTDERSNA
jgi:excisionase family DNA binding protein